MSMSERDSYADEYCERAQWKKGYSDGYAKGFADAKKKYGERPHGEWIFDKDYPMLGSPYGSYKCSECGMHTDDDVDHYCWFCGADMRKVKRNENI